MLARSQTTSICFKTKFYEDWVSIRRLSFLYCLPDIRTAWINPCSWHNCPFPFYPFMSKFFRDVEIFEVFCDDITPIKLRMPSGENTRYQITIYSSWLNICIHSLELGKISKPAPSDLFRDTNYTELFVELFKSDNHKSSEPYYSQ